MAKEAGVGALGGGLCSIRRLESQESKAPPGVEKAEQFHSSRMPSEREEITANQNQRGLASMMLKVRGALGEVLKQGTGVVRYVS